MVVLTVVCGALCLCKTVREIKSFLVPFSNAASARGSHNCNSIRTKCVQTHIFFSILEHIGDAVFFIKIMANEIDEIARLVYINFHQHADATI